MTTDTRTARDVFEILVRENADMLTAYLRSLVWSTSSVDDLFQETMLVAWRRLADYDRTKPFSPWLRGIAQRLVMEHHRRGRARPATVDPGVLAELDNQYEQLGKTVVVSFRDRAERVLDCLRRLPDQMREAVEMVYARGMLMAAVAGSLAVTEEAIKKRVQRGRQLLAECVQATREDR